VSWKAKIKKIELALENLSPHETHCTLCPHECGINRRKGETGFCESGPEASVSHAIPHYGEEPVLSGYADCAANAQKDNGLPSGSGTLFFSGCNLKCLYCQNYQLSWLNQGHVVSSSELAETILTLQNQRVLNINLVTPVHMLIPILRGLQKAYAGGLHLPVVYNTSAYEKAETVRQLEGIIDVYLPDLKYRSPRVSQRYSNAPDYFQHASRAIEEMFRQQPELMFDRDETVRKGLIIRHLLLPGTTADSLSVLEWIAESISLSVGLSLMSQYVPCFRAPEEIRKKITPDEYKKVVNKAQELKFETLFLQPALFSRDENLVPDFNKNSPFKWGPK
jgi:putative pyruvate formate lyase activating enzyme